MRVACLGLATLTRLGYATAVQQPPLSLWAQETCAPWHQALEQYPAAVAAHGSARLVELDRWLREALPPAIAARPAPGVTTEELGWVTEWKMLRGAWRPRNLQLVRGNSTVEVERVSAEALQAVPDPRRPVALLTRLAGVGPATASAVLATAAPEHYPFFDEVVAVQMPGLGPVAFTGAYYQRYAAALRQRAAALSAACPHGDWPVHHLDLALWVVGAALKPARR